MTNEKLLNKHIKENNWMKAEIVCNHALEAEPASHWWLLNLGNVLIELKRYTQAEQVLHQADQAKSHCPLLQWYQGVLAYEQCQWATALLRFKKLHTRCLQKLNSDDLIQGCWETIRRTNELDNDCRGRIGFCFYHLDDNKKAVHWLKKHLKNRKKGQFSIYNKKIVQDWIERLCS